MAEVKARTAAKIAKKILVFILVNEEQGKSKEVKNLESNRVRGTGCCLAASELDKNRPEMTIVEVKLNL